MWRISKGRPASGPLQITGRPCREQPGFLGGGGREAAFPRVHLKLTSDTGELGYLYVCA